jgi:CheY-like chemotaxis protein
MRILICEDSEHNLQSAREFAEKVKGEHEVVIINNASRAGQGVSGGGYSPGEFYEEGVLTPLPARPTWDCVLTDLYLPDHVSGTSLPGGFYVALAALQNNVPACIITDGDAHGDDRLVCAAEISLQRWNKRLHFRFVNAKSKEGVKGLTPDGKVIKDWEYCFQQLIQNTAAA